MRLATPTFFQKDRIHEVFFALDMEPSPVQDLCPLLAIGVALLAGCGGSGSVKDPFRPARLMVVGDEASHIGANDAGLTGAQYSVNRYKTDATTGKPTLPLTIDCLSYGNWAIRLAADINSVVATSTDELTNSPRFNFAQCNPNNKSTAATFMMAAKSQTVDSAIAAIDAHVASKGVGGRPVRRVCGQQRHLGTVRPVRRQRGRRQVGRQGRATKLAKRINQLTDQGAKVLIVALPDLATHPMPVPRPRATLHGPRGPDQRHGHRVQPHAQDHADRRWSTHRPGEL